MRRSIFGILLMLLAISVNAQSGNSKVDDFLREKRAKIESFKVEKDLKIKNFRDSLNDVYGDFLAQQWEKVQIFKNNETFDPMPEPPVYIEEPPLVKSLPPAVDLIPLPDAEDLTPVILPVKKPVPLKASVEFDFYSERFLLLPVNSQIEGLKDTTEPSVSNFWKELSTLDLDIIVGTLTELSEGLELDAWGINVLVDKMIDAYFPGFNENEKAITQVFILNQLGYKAKIASSRDNLFVTLSIKTKLSNTSFFKYDNGETYYVLNPQHLPFTEIRSCMADYSKDGKSFDLQLHKLPKLEGDMADYAAYLSTYPCMEFHIYAEAPLSRPMKEYISENLEPELAGLTPLQGINKLLNIVSNHPYKNDIDNYGYEKWNFAEESIIEEFTDCDDNAILLAQLAQYLYGLDVVLLHYEKVHLATAICFPNENVNGDKVTYNGKTYMVCDPTYRNAKVGMEMKSSNVKAAKLTIIPVNS